MTAKKSTGLATYMAVTGSIKDALDGSFIYVYDGVEPATADAALSGNTLLAKYSVGNDGTTGLTFSSTPVAGVLQKTAAETWSATVLADGTASFYRMCVAAPTGASTTDVRLQGSVGTSMLDDLTMTSTTFTTGDSKSIDQFQIY
ncbi:hypothetical protein [Rhodanobacter lindaniclasticus]